MIESPIKIYRIDNSLQNINYKYSFFKDRKIDTCISPYR